jgi:serine/threonine-protein kinase
LAQVAALPKPGDIVGGKYRVERKLGSGGMGAVFEVTHRVTNKRFAIKWLLPEVATEDGALKRFMREAQVAGRFEHPNVVEVYDIGQDGPSFYMVMELLEGESLAERIARQPRLTPDEVCGLLVPCLEGVAAAHAAGIIHRDLKPANLFVCAARNQQPEHAKVLDFGISKLSSAPGIIDATLTRAGAVMGTPHYMAPEQMRAQPVDERADVYAFGVILYEMLSGRRPFDAQTYADLVLQVLGEAPRPLREHVPELPIGLCDVVARAMAREPSGRYASLHALRDALGPYYRPITLSSAPLAHGAKSSARPQLPAAATGEQPETPLFSESVYSSNRQSFRWHRAQLWIAGTFGLGLLAAFIAAVFSRPDTAALHSAPALHELRPVAPAAAPDAPEPLPDVVHLELAPGQANSAEFEAAKDAGLPVQIDPQPTAAEVEPTMGARGAVPPPRSAEPRRAARRASRVESADAPATGAVRPRIALDRDDFGGM